MANNLQTICPNCSSPLPNNVRFCTKCGTKIEEKKNIEPTQTEKDSKIENYPNNNTSYRRTQNQPTNDPVESLKESGKDFMRDIGSLFNKASESNRPRQQYHPTDEPEPAQNYKTGNDEFDQLQYLEKLAELKDKGIISDEEFEKKKKDILKL